MIFTGDERKSSLLEKASCEMKASKIHSEKIISERKNHPEDENQQDQLRKNHLPEKKTFHKMKASKIHPETIISHTIISPQDEKPASQLT
jgi:hypothetical protein